MNNELRANIVPPFALNDAELSGILNFAHENGLDEICKLVAELRTLRKDYLSMCQQIGYMKSQLAILKPQAQQRFANELEQITDATPKS